MKPNSVIQSDQAYKRGLVLGLTMAEVILLLLFSLLLALAALFLETEKKMEKVSHERDMYVNELRINEAKLKVAMAELSRADLGSIKKELVRLKVQEEQIARLLDHLEIDKKAPIPERLNLLFEKTTKLNKVVETIKKAGFPIEPKKLETTLGHMEGVRSEIAKLEKTLKESKSENKKITQKLDDIEQGLSQKDGQIANMKRILDRVGKGTEKPACWADETTGKPKYIYNAGLKSKGIIVRHSETPPWAKSRRLPIDDIHFNKLMTPREFLREANPIFQWSEKNDCRFWVRVYDVTGPGEKETYKRQMRFLESRFYQYEVQDDPWQ